MKIGYYLAGVADGLAQGGTAPYAHRLMEQLIPELPDFKFHLIAKASQAKYINFIKHAFQDAAISHSYITTPRGTTFVNVASAILLAHDKKPLRRFLRHLNLVEMQLARQQFDVLHCPVQVLPFYDWRHPFIITMHDVQELHMPHFFAPKERWIRSMNFWNLLENAAKVVVSFQHVKDDLIRLFDLKPDKVHVCPIPVNSAWFASKKTENASAILEKYGINEPFMLYPAQTWEHKNHTRLLQAMAYLRDHEKVVPPLLICTGKKNEFFQKISLSVEALNLQEKVRFLGVIPDAELQAMYLSCAFVVIPTLYEAGSFPLYEAMMLDKPVICAQTTSLPDGIRDSRFTFDPRNVGEMASMIKRMFTDSEYLKENRK